MLDHITTTLTSLFTNKKVGIWGFGKTGQSILECICPYAQDCYIMESSQLTEEQQAFSKKHNGQIVSAEYLSQFFEVCDLIIPSPGIDITPYKEKYPNKFLSELDIFGGCVQTHIIAITGSVGKTTTVSLLEQILNKLGKRTKALGNIGTPMLSCIKDQQLYDYFILEVSSFQLEHIQSFSPTIATILNILPNHLDRHGTMESYLHAKGQLLAHQTEKEYAILPLPYMDEFWPFVRQQKVHWVGNDAYDYIIQALSDLTAKENIVLILAILENIGFEAEAIIPFIQELHRPAHRMELVRIHKGISFYNDSKATIAQSTLQALEQCKDRPTILLLGGLSKGVSRHDLIKQLPKTLKYVVCFGAEADQLHAWCMDEVLASSSHPTLEDAWQKALEIAQSGDIVLLSPAGTSYDLFKNFEERGNQFKKLIATL